MALHYENDEKKISITYNDKEILKVYLYNDYLSNWFEIEINKLSEAEQNMINRIYCDVLTTYEEDIAQINTDLYTLG